MVSKYKRKDYPKVVLIKSVLYPHWEERQEEIQTLNAHHKIEKTTENRAYTFDGYLIGTLPFTRNLFYAYQISPEGASEKDDFASIGYSKKYNKWFGWEREKEENWKIEGFGIGDYFFEKVNKQFDTMQRPRRYIETMDEAKQSAINFAKSLNS